MTDLDLDELRRLTREATPGPWGDGRADAYADRRSFGRLDDPGLIRSAGWFSVGHAFTDPDTDLIVAVRNALPELLDRIERLERVAEAAREGHGRSQCAACDAARRGDDAALMDALTALDEIAGGKE